MSRLETQAKQAWVRWGVAWALFTMCSSCHEHRYCRGQRKNRLLCLTCFDLGKR